jgi:hypothetical protein
VIQVALTPDGKHVVTGDGIKRREVSKFAPALKYANGPGGSGVAATDRPAAGQPGDSPGLPVRMSRLKGSTLRQMRLDRGLSLRHMAEECGLQEWVIRSAERASTCLSRETPESSVTSTP